MNYFDYEPVAHEAGMSPAQLARIVERVCQDFPRDEMLRELHILRVCRAVRDRHVDFERLFPEAIADCAVNDQ